MAYTKVQICNLALSKIGDEGAQITSFTGTTKEVRLCNLYYEPILRECIRMHSWNCAKVQGKLAQLTEEAAFKWEYVYQLPSDFIRLVEISSTESKDRRNNYNFEYELMGRKLYTNESDVWVTYDKYIEDPNDMDSLFVKCFYTMMAEAMSFPLTEDRTLQLSIRQELDNVILPEARSVNSFEGYEYPVSDSALLEARFTNNNYYPPFAQSDYGDL